MSDSDPPTRRYDDDQVGRILRRATELQKEESSGPSGARGLSLSELEEIAGEAGIDPALVRRAAREMETRVGGESPWTFLIGEPPTIVLERTVPGELDEEGFESVARAIRLHAGVQGQPSLLGRILTWRAETPSHSRTLQVTVSCRGGETHIFVEERLHQLASGLFGGLMGGGGLGIGLGVGVVLGVEVLGSLLFSILFPLGVVGAAYGAARAIFTTIARRRRRALADLLECVTDSVTAHARDRIEAPDPDRLPRG